MFKGRFHITIGLFLTFCLIFILSGCTRQDEGTLSLFNRNILSPSDNVILALFDGSEDQTFKDNEIRAFLQIPLEKMGYKLTYHDINKGLPSRDLTSNSRAIITWFTDSSMLKAESYCLWLAGCINDGKKVVIFDNFGAYQDSISKKWTEMHIVNNVLNKLGISYKANWTDNNALLQVVYKNADVVEQISPIDISRARHYYLFEKIDENILPFLTIRRKDQAESESYIIFSHPNGGMAFSRYFMTRDKDTGYDVPNTDLSRFLKSALFPLTTKTQRILIIADEFEGENGEYIVNMVRTLKYAKIQFDIISLENLEKLLAPDLNKYSSLVFFAENIWRLEEKSTTVIKEYVKNGGGVLIGRRAENELLSDLFGISDTNGFFDNSLMGMKVTASFFPGSEHLFYEGDDLEHHSLDVDLNKDVKVLAVALEGNNRYPQGIPVAWLNKYGNGRVVFWNTDSMNLGSLRGLLLQSLLLSQPVSVYSLANIENIHIDDFPRPSYNIFMEPVKSTLNMTDTEFYLNVWWKSIIKLADKYDIKYTCYAVFNYDSNIAPPFSGREFEYGKNSAFAESCKKIIDNDFEIGLHGYNHQSLTLRNSDTKDWKNQEHMRQSLEQAGRLWKELFPETETLFSYVAPMNLIDAAGKIALHEALPSVRIISQLFSQEDPARHQEFGWDQDVPYFFNIPRITAGYSLDHITKNDLINIINTFGIWTHFIHPDDIYSVQTTDPNAPQGQKDKDWDSMAVSANSLFTFVRETFPWLRSMTTRETYYELDRYFDTRSRVEIEDNIITISFPSGSDKKKYFGLKINNGKRITKIENCVLIHSYPGLNLSIFETRSNRSRIRLTGK